MFGFGFWNAGALHYRKALATERREQLADLKQKMTTCATRIEKDSMRAEIRQLKAEYRRKFRAIRESNFATT